MVKIIERGTKTITTCDHCGCKFSYEVEDVQIKYSFIDEAKKHGEYVTCPQCNKEVIICQSR